VIAERTERAILEDRFWVLAEDDYWRGVCEARLDGIRARRNPDFTPPEGH